MAVIAGQTTAESYVLNVPGDSHYNILPLLTVGDEIPLLTGEGLSTTTDTTQTYAFAGIPDGIGVYEQDGKYFVFVNHEFSRTATSHLNGTSSEIVKGARVSLLVFDQDWNAIGGKNLIDTVVDHATGTTYTLNTTTGFYTAGTATLSFDRFCSAYLAEYGFVDASGQAAPVFFGPEEGGSGGNRGWAIFPDGTASSIDGLGRYAKENIVAASQYRATNSDKTVLLSTEDFGDGEIYMWVGNQTADDPNGLKLENGDLYVLKVTGFDWETMPEGASQNATWVKVPKDIITTDDLAGSKLTAFVNKTENGVAINSTNFRRPEDIHEDPNNPGTFYFVTTGRTEKNGSLTLQATTPAEADNPYGKLYRFTLNSTDPTAAMQIEMILEGGLGQGISYDNMVVTQDGKILIQEDLASSFAEDVMLAEGRDNAQIWVYDIATDSIQPLFQADESIAANNTLTDPGRWETSGIVEVGNGAYLFDVQAHGVASTRYVEGGQLVLALPVQPTLTGTAGDNTLLGNDAIADVISGGAGDDYLWGGSGGKDILLGGAGNDQINGNGEDNTLNGGEGDNHLYGCGGNDTFIAGNGDDIAYGEDGNDIFNLGNGDNQVYANAGDNRVSTGNGDDLIYAGAGRDIITAGDGNNTILAGNGFNRIATGTGNDEIWSGVNGSNIQSGAGDDIIYAGGGNNKIAAGAGENVITVGWDGKGVDTFVLDAGIGSTTIFGYAATDKISLGSGLAAADLTIAISGSDTVISKGADLLATLKWFESTTLTFA